MKLKGLLQESQSDQSARNQAHVSFLKQAASKPKTLLADNITPMELLQILKSKFDLNTKPDIEYINYKMPLSNILRHKVQAVLTVIETDMASQDLVVFEKVGEAFNNRFPRFELIMPLSPGECAWTVYCINKLNPQKFSDEVIHYIAACLSENGILLAPKELEFCQPVLEKFTGISDVAEIKKALSSNTKHKSEIVNRQVEKLKAIEEYIKSEGKI